MGRGRERERERVTVTANKSGSAPRGQAMGYGTMSHKTSKKETNRLVVCLICNVCNCLFVSRDCGVCVCVRKV